jgi:hypothetical protein
MYEAVQILSHFMRSTEGYRTEHINSMEHSPSQEAGSHSGSQEITYLLWNLKDYYHVYKILPKAKN